MSDFDGTDTPMAEDHFENLGRRAGAELRTPAPVDGLRRVQRAAVRRRVGSIAAPAAVIAALAVGGLLLADRGGRGGETAMVAEPATSASTSLIPSTVVLTGEDLVHAIAVSADGTRVAAGSRVDAEWAGAVHVWDILTGEPLLEIDAAGSWDVAFSPDGQSVAARLVDPDGLQSTSFWSVADGTATEPFVTPWDSPDYIDFPVDGFFPSPDGKTAVQVRRFGPADLIDAESGAKIRTLPGSGTSWVAAYDRDGSTVAVKFDYSVRLWRLDPFQELPGFILPKYDGTAERMEFTPDGTRLVFTVENNVFIVRVDEQGATRELTGRPKDN